MVKSKVELIDYIVNHYKNNPRAIDAETGKCLYVKGCAVSICLKDEVDRSKLDSYIDKRGKLNTSIVSLTRDNILSLNDFKPEFQIDDLELWHRLQWLHDGDEYWKTTDTGNELTEKGMNEYKDLIAENAN